MKCFKINGGKKLSGKIAVNGSKNATVALFAAAMINKGKTTLKKVTNIAKVLNKNCFILRSRRRRKNDKS